MSSPLSVKRRKLNESTARLSKPFVSPLRAQNNEPQPPVSENKENETKYLPSTLAHTVKAIPAANAMTFKSTNRLSYSTPAKSTPIRKQHAYTSSTKRKDQAELQAERAITSLEMELRKVRNDIETLDQAAKLRSTTTDHDLEKLTQKWKEASQSAAEELFGTVKERVNRMGGVAAWRESEKRKYDRSNGLGEFAQEVEESDDADCEFDSQGEELPEEEQEYRKALKRQARREMRDAADVEEVGPEDEGERREKAVWQEPGGEDDVSSPLRWFWREDGVLTLFCRPSRWI